MSNYVDNRRKYLDKVVEFQNEVEKIMFEIDLINLEKVKYMNMRDQTIHFRLTICKAFIHEVLRLNQILEPKMKELQEMWYKYDTMRYQPNKQERLSAMIEGMYSPERNIG
jgi:hypothetical protein